MTRNQLKKFFANRPAISKKTIAEEAGIHHNTLYDILKGKFQLTDDVFQKLEPVLKRYGWNPSD